VENGEVCPNFSRKTAESETELLQAVEAWRCMSSVQYSILKSEHTRQSYEKWPFDGRLHYVLQLCRN